MNRGPFNEYRKEGEPEKYVKYCAWSTAIGLQDVDGLKPSQYLLDTAKRNIEGEITIEEAKERIQSYYEDRSLHVDAGRTEEADKVSSRIAELLSENAFSFSAQEYLTIHKRLFTGIHTHAGKIRTYNISKKEWVLDGDSVIYGSASQLRETLEYDLSREKERQYAGMAMDQMIQRLCEFVAGLWQIHVFGEGNTRTTAVFFIKYLRFLGFPVVNDTFLEHSWYFRNALVRANYSNLPKGIYRTTRYLERFLRNVLLDEEHTLKNRDMHI